ncbi:hypothetical protein GGQ84_000751 [Desulfitispora alkaliphila]|uniref:sulfite exporter TauE/SafE family protein n=1 Tax=Desulfitispora alkaliphila TaxID=622674 RepID=UPI003D196FD5
MFTFVEVTLLLTGVLSGFFGGLLGIGGATILIPILMYLLPVLGVEFTFHQITGLSMAQVFFAALIGAITHYQGKNLRKNLIIIVGGPLLVGSFLGAATSKFISEQALVAIFAFVLFLSIVMMFKKKDEDASCDIDTENYLSGNKEKAIGASIGGFAGILAGLVGVGGAAFLIPALTYFLNIPIKICIGTSLGIILAGGASGFLGKAVTGQVPFVPAFFIVMGAMVGSRIGSKVSIKLKGHNLKKILLIFLIVILIRVVLSLFNV